MDKIKLDNWLGVIGNLAVVIGLIVVAIELHQNLIVANGELTSQFFTNWQQIDNSRQDPSFALVYAKSIDRPEELTLGKEVQLDGYFWSVTDQLELGRNLVESELFFSADEEIVRPNVQIFLTTPYAQAWRESHKVFSDLTTISIVDDEIEKISSETAHKFFNTIESTLSE